jgi:hypothetical protein
MRFNCFVSSDLLEVFHVETVEVLKEHNGTIK